MHTPADSADTLRQMQPAPDLCSCVVLRAYRPQHHTTANPTRDRIPPGYHIYGSARDSRGNAGHQTAMRHTRMHASLSSAFLPRASVTRWMCPRREGRRAHTRMGGPGPCLAGTHTEVVHAARGRRAANKHSTDCTPYSLLFAPRMHVIYVTTA